MRLHPRLTFGLATGFRLPDPVVLPAATSKGKHSVAIVDGLAYWRAILRWVLFVTFLQASFVASVAVAQANGTVGFGKYVTFGGNYDLGYHETQFFEPNHNAAVGQWDTRVNVWLPPFQDAFSWGPYLHIGGIGASQPEAWENGWLGGPGVGFQVYPFSESHFRKRDSRVGSILGPLRFLVEFNKIDYWGAENRWRPHHQTRVGAEYWRARHVNSATVPWWTEIWSELIWQSSNEFDPHYNSGIFASSIRAGARVPKAHFLSTLTPYLAVESTLTSNRQYYWENKLVGGGGLRFAPPLKRSIAELRWLNRFAIYGEYVHVACYYRQQAPALVPNHDVRVGITFDLGQWYR